MSLVDIKVEFIFQVVFKQATWKSLVPFFPLSILLRLLHISLSPDGEIVNELLMSIGYLHGAQDEDCPVMQKILKMKPKYLEV
jgi:hypothetical protein